VRFGKAEVSLPFSRGNFQIFGIGLLVIVIGYIFLLQGPWDSFWSRTLAPIVLLIGYCVLIPLSILYNLKSGGGGKVGG